MGDTEFRHGGGREKGTQSHFALLPELELSSLMELSYLMVKRLWLSAVPPAVVSRQERGPLMEAPWRVMRRYE